MMNVGEYSLGEIEALVEKSHGLAWWQYLLVFLAVQVLVVLIFRQSSNMMNGIENGSGKIRPAFSRLLSIPSMRSYSQFSYSPSQRSPSKSPKEKDY